MQKQVQTYLLYLVCLCPGTLSTIFHSAAKAHFSWRAILVRKRFYLAWKCEKIYEIQWFIQLLSVLVQHSYKKKNIYELSYSKYFNIFGKI